MQPESAQRPKCADDSYKAEQAATGLSSKYSHYANWYGKLTDWWKARYRLADSLQCQTACFSYHLPNAITHSFNHIEQNQAYLAVY